jgi:hypothetical protein
MGLLAEVHSQPVKLSEASGVVAVPVDGQRSCCSSLTFRASRRYQNRRSASGRAPRH